MNAGELRHRVTLEKPTHTVNANGEVVEGWEPVEHPWAKIRPLKAWEIERARQVQMRTTHEVTLRYNPAIAATITPGCRIVYGALVLNITSIVNVGMRNVELLLTCEEVTQP